MKRVLLFIVFSVVVLMFVACGGAGGGGLANGPQILLNTPENGGGV
jgi:hypothetical protein